MIVNKNDPVSFVASVRNQVAPGNDSLPPARGISIKHKHKHTNANERIHSFRNNNVYIYTYVVVH